MSLAGKGHADAKYIKNNAGNMIKLRMKVLDCRPGMMVAETIYNEHGAVILVANTVLDRYTIIKLIKIGIDSIQVYIDCKSEISSAAFKSFKAEYEKNLQHIRGMISDVRMGKPLDIQKVNQVSQSILTKVNMNRDILRCISHVYGIDEYEYTHPLNVGMLCMLIARWLGYDDENTKAVLTAGLLHDIGKSKIDLSVLKKHGSLLPEEFELVKRHASYSFSIIKDIPELNVDICSGIIMHHEREDGSGYPLGLKSHRIHRYAKIIAVADVYDAMTSNRVYSQKESPFEVFELLQTGDMGKLDTEITFTFVKKAADYYIGDKFFLSNGEVGEIIYINPTRVSRPLLKVRDQYVDMLRDQSLRLDMMV